MVFCSYLTVHACFYLTVHAFCQQRLCQLKQTAVRHSHLHRWFAACQMLQSPPWHCALGCVTQQLAGHTSGSWRAEGAGAQSAADQALDKLTRPLHDWQRLAGKCQVPLWFRVVVRLGHGRFLGRRLLQRLVGMLCQSATLALAYTQVSWGLAAGTQEPSGGTVLCTLLQTGGGS